jgi:alanine dehydrogenase
MLIGVPKEIKVLEARVSLTPDGVSEFVRAGHQVIIEKGAGTGSAISDEDYISAGAKIEPDVEKLWKSAGLNAAVIALGMGADVTVLDRSLPRLAYIDTTYKGSIKTLASSFHAIDREIKSADLVIGAVLVHGAKAPKLVTNAQVKLMKPGAVLVDIAIDQGGCFEDSHPTTHAEPTFKVHDAIFYCVANMPGAVPVTSTFSLTNATLPYALSLANNGWEAACEKDPALAKGLNVHAGKIRYEAVALAHGYPI